MQCLLWNVFEKFSVSVESNVELRYFCFISLCDWSRKLVPLYFKFSLDPIDICLALIALVIALVLV